MSSQPAPDVLDWETPETMDVMAPVMAFSAEGRRQWLSSVMKRKRTCLGSLAHVKGTLSI